MKVLYRRRTFLKTAAATVGALGTSFAPNVLLAERSPKLRVGYLPITDATPLLIAHARNFFKDEGLDLDKPIRMRSWSSLLEAFLSGKFNVTHMLFPIPVWMRFKNKAPVKILAWNHTNGSAITVRGDSDIRDFSDLGGRQIAVPYWYSIHNIILQMGLHKYGLKPVIQPQHVKLKQNEVNLFVLAPPEMPAALAGSKIDGYIVAEPFNAISEIKTGANIMRFTGDVWKNHPCCVVVMNEGITKRNPVFTQKVVNAIVRAQYWINHNIEETAKILSRDGENYLPLPENILLRSFTGYDLPTYGEGKVPQAIHHAQWKIGRIGFQPWPFPSATRTIIKKMGETLMEGDTTFLKKLNVNRAAIELVNDSFVKNALDNIGGVDVFHSEDTDNPWEREETIEI